MRHGFSLSSCRHLQRTNLYPSTLHLQSKFVSPTFVPILRWCYGGHTFDILLLNPQSLGVGPTCTNIKKRRRCGVYVRASARDRDRDRDRDRETPYQVLGISPSATPNEIKRAYRKLALKYHPDVNKQENAQEKFMRIKHAYNTLINSDSRSRYDSSNRKSDFSYSSWPSSQKAQEEEEFYGFGEFLRDVQDTVGDFFKDLQEEFQNWEANASSQGKPKSLWEELAEVGEEFVEFLEKELNITDQDVGVEGEGSFGSSGPRGENNVDSNTTGGKSSIEESIDEIEAALAQLKKELGL